MQIKTNYPQSDRVEMLKFVINKPVRSLEVGCREGLHSKLLKNSFDTLKETWGIEPDSDPILIESAKTNLDVFINDYLTKDTKLPKRSFDLIVFNDVLEHMYDPWGVLLVAKELLTGGGNSGSLNTKY